MTRPSPCATSSAAAYPCRCSSPSRYPESSGDPPPGTRQNRTLEAVLGGEDRAALDDHFRPLGHARHDGVRRIDLHLDDRAAHEVLGRVQIRDHIPHRQVKLRHGDMLALLKVTSVPPPRTKASSARTPTAPIPPS